MARVPGWGLWAACVVGCSPAPAPDPPAAPTVAASPSANAPPSLPDADSDGLPDERDACPEVPEDIDNFEDLDGCPDEDNDSDGFPDVKDKCPMEPEDCDVDRNTDGCPEYGHGSIAWSHGTVACDLDAERSPCGGGSGSFRCVRGPQAQVGVCVSARTPLSKVAERSAGAACELNGSDPCAWRKKLGWTQAFNTQEASSCRPAPWKNTGVCVPMPVGGGCPCNTEPPYGCDPDPGVAASWPGPRTEGEARAIARACDFRDVGHAVRVEGVTEGEARWLVTCSSQFEPTITYEAWVRESNGYVTAPEGRLVPRPIPEEAPGFAR